SHIGGITGIAGTWAGIGGNPNSFIVPVTTKTSPATMRRMLSIRSVQGDGDDSNIDITCTHFEVKNGVTIDSNKSVLVMIVTWVVPGRMASCDRGRPTMSPGTPPP